MPRTFSARATPAAAPRRGAEAGAKSARASGARVLKGTRRARVYEGQDDEEEEDDDQEEELDEEEEEYSDNSEEEQDGSDNQDEEDDEENEEEESQEGDDENADDLEDGEELDEEQDDDDEENDDDDDEEDAEEEDDDEEDDNEDADEEDDNVYIQDLNDEITDSGGAIASRSRSRSATLAAAGKAAKAAAAAAAAAAGASASPSRARRVKTNFHGYPCHKCKKGIGFNAKVCRGCKTPVKKPPPRYKSPKKSGGGGSTESNPTKSKVPQMKAKAHKGEAAPSSSLKRSHKKLRIEAADIRVTRDGSSALDYDGKGNEEEADEEEEGVVSGTGASGNNSAARNRKGSKGNKGGYSTPRHRKSSRAESGMEASDAGGEEEDVPDDLVQQGAVFLSKSGSVAHMKTEREGHAFVHSVSRPKSLPPAPVEAPLSPLDSFSAKQIELHIRALQAETFQRRFRPLIIRLMENALNGDMFNAPVDPIKYCIPDYTDVIKQPMDLGTVRQKLEAGRYEKPEELAADVVLTFNNAIRYNPEGHNVHNAARRLKEEFLSEFARLTSKNEVDVRRKEAHSCGFCQGQMCKLCGDKCLRFDPPVMSCDCCMERIKRGDIYYRAPSGQRWCARCVSNGGANAEPGAILPPVALLKLASAGTLEALMKHLGVSGSGSIAAAALSAATSTLGRFGATNAAAAAASITLQAAASEQQQHQHQLHGSASTSKTSKSVVTKSAGRLTKRNTVNTMVTTSSQGGSLQSLPYEHTSSSSSSSSATSASLTSMQPAGASGFLTPRTNFGGPTSLLMVGHANSSHVVLNNAEEATSSATGGPSATQLLATLRASGVDTTALAAAAQAAASSAAAGNSTSALLEQRSTLATLAAILRGRLEKRRNDDVVAEPWVQCDRCKGWVHQVCAMFNARKNAVLPFNAEYNCPVCRRDELLVAEAEAKLHAYGTRHKHAIPPILRLPPESPRLTPGQALVIPAVPAATAASLTGPGLLAVRTRANLTAEHHSSSSGGGGGGGGAGLPTRSSSSGNLSALASSGSGQANGSNTFGSLSSAISPRGSQILALNGPVKYEGANVISNAATLGVGAADVGTSSSSSSSSSYALGLDGGSLAAPTQTPRSTSSASVTFSNGVGGGGVAGSSNASDDGSMTPAVLAASADPSATASALPHTPLSRELEWQVREKLRESHHPLVAESIVVRVVSSLKKTIGVPREVRNVFGAEVPDPSLLVKTVATSDTLSSSALESVIKSGMNSDNGGSNNSNGNAAAVRNGLEYAAEYVYRQRVILLFQRLDGVDVCLFALYVQEYGADCPPPNGRKVYIAYLDSVRYLRPLKARTVCYHELLAAYLSNARHRGYDTCHIWACPPQRGDGYIFHVHPPSQRVPGKERLREWYDDMLEPLLKEGTITSINSLYDQFFEAVPAHSSSTSGSSTLVSSSSLTSSSSSGGSGYNTTGIAMDVDVGRRSSNSSSIASSLPAVAIAALELSAHHVTGGGGAEIGNGAGGGGVGGGGGGGGKHHPPQTSRSVPPGLRKFKKESSGTASRCGTSHTTQKSKPKASAAPAVPDVIQLKKGVGLPPYFAGDFWASEMERFIREQHKRLAARAARVAVNGSSVSGSSSSSRQHTAKSSLAATTTSTVTKASSPGGGGSKNKALTVVVPASSPSRGTAAPTSSPTGGTLSRLISVAASAIGLGFGSSNNSSINNATLNVHETYRDGAASGATTSTSKSKALAIVDAEGSGADSGTMTRKRSRSEAAASGGKRKSGSSPKRAGNTAAVAAGGGGGGGSSSSSSMGGAVAIGYAGPLGSGGSASAALSAFSRSSLGVATLTDYVAKNPPISIPGSVKVGDIAIPSHPISAVGSRLKDMQREIFVVHLAPLRPRGTRAAGDSENTASSSRYYHHHHFAGSESTMSDQEDVDGESEAAESERSEGHVQHTGKSRSNAGGGGGGGGADGGRASSSSRATSTTRASSTRSALGRRNTSNPVYGSETDDTDMETTRAQAATNASDALEDERITCDFFDTRQGFLRMCQGNNYQFDTLRRAKHSSMMILWHLHNPSIPAYAHACNVCETDIGCGTRWHCEACYDYDICDNCHSSPELNHPHPLIEKHDNNIVVKVANGYVAAGGKIYQASPARGGGHAVSSAASNITGAGGGGVSSGGRSGGNAALQQALLVASGGGSVVPTHSSRRR